jgi:hypothetical protein
MRKSIFDIVAENMDMESEANRLVTMSSEECVLVVNTYTDETLFNYIDAYCFKEWEHRGHFVDVDDFLEALRYDDLKEDATHNVDALLTLIELIYNFWELSRKQFHDTKKGYKLEWCGNYYHLKDVMDDVLSQYNHVAYINEDQECVLIIEDKSEVTAAAEIMPTPALAVDVVRYNHRTLRGEIELKKKILLAMGAELEAKRKKLHTINTTLENDIFFMLNNLNIRHNNKSKGDKNYKEYVAKMRKDRLEKWYDELYQMLLLAFLLMDNIERVEKVKGLKEKINAV